jgi:membrane protein DedA with SNARE-associated domain
MFREFHALSSPMRGKLAASHSRCPKVDEALAYLSSVTSQVQGLIDFVGSHPHFALMAVFLLALSEAVPVVGTVVPGSTAILGISALATTAQLNPWLLLIAATLGAIAGDGFSFWLGMRYHAAMLRRWPLNRYPQLIARSKSYIERYGIASVFLARFTAVVRAFVPMLAGVLRMSPPHFYAANVASALVWAPMHVFPGVLLAMALSLVGIRAERFILLVLAAAVLASTLWGLLRARSRERAAAPIRPSRLLAVGERTRRSGP